MIILVNNSTERDIVLTYLNLKRGTEFFPENAPKEACFIIETDRGIVVTDKPEYIAFHQRKTNESITTFTKFVKEIMFGHICKLVQRNRYLMDRLNTYRGIACEQNKQIEIFQQIFKL